MSGWLPCWSDGAAERRLNGLDSVLHSSSTSYWQRPLCQALNSAMNQDSACLEISPYNLGNPAITYATLQTVETMNEKDRERAWGLEAERDLISIQGRNGGQGRLSGGNGIGAEVQRVSRSHQEKRWVTCSLGRRKSKCRSPERGGACNNSERPTWKTGHCSPACPIQCNSAASWSGSRGHHQVPGPLPVSQGLMVGVRSWKASPYPQGLAQSGWEGPLDMWP